MLSRSDFSFFIHCVVAATGLPEPRADHAIAMARFARQCMRKFEKIIREHLEPRLGPSTLDLRARCGIHSGKVTAGVLRGEKARFQVRRYSRISDPMFSCTIQ